MKKLLIAFSMIGAVALVACATDNSTDNSVKPTYAEESWFGAKVTNGEIDPDRGEFKIKEGGESTVEVSGDKIEIDSELSDPVSFVLDEKTAEPLTTKLARVTFELDPAVVPFSARPTDLENVKVAFALCENAAGTATNFCAWTGSDWKDLNFAIPTDTYTLTMNFDESDDTAKKVQFSIGAAKSDWFTYTPALYDQKPQIDFVGSGKITQLAAAQRKLVEAEIEITGGSVTIAGDDMGAMNALKSDGETIEAVLNATVQSKFPASGIDATLTVAEAYAIGMITKNDEGAMEAKGNDAFNVKADATATTTDGIKVRFVAPLNPNDTTANITYGLKGSKNGTDWVEFTDVSEKSNQSDIVIPTDKVTAGYRYFKVVTKVALKPTNAQ